MEDDEDNLSCDYITRLRRNSVLIMSWKRQSDQTSRKEIPSCPGRRGSPT